MADSDTAPVTRSNPAKVPAAGDDVTLPASVSATPCAGAPGAAAGAALDFLAPADEKGGLGRLGPYRVLEVLGRGGMGIVLRAEDPALNRTVALKVMTPAAAQVAGAHERFLREARVVASISHDNIVTIFQVGEDRGVPYFAMQFLKGMTLDEWLRRGKKPTPRQVMKVGREIAQGLAAAHAVGLIHRDIKPANIWLDATKGGRAIILDFGLARPAADASHITEVGTILGTPSYMSPEQARNTDIGPRSDLFSLGCLLYRLCTGQVPFPGKDMMSTLMALANDQPRPVRELNPDVPGPVCELIRRLLEKDPAARPASARAVAEAFAAIERDLISASSRESIFVLPVPESAPEPDYRPEPPGRTRPKAAGLSPALQLWLVAAVLVAALVVVCTGVAVPAWLYFFRAAPEPGPAPAAFPAPVVFHQFQQPDREGPFVKDAPSSRLELEPRGPTEVADALTRADAGALGKPFRRFDVALQKGRTYQIDLASDDFDAYLSVYDDGWTRVAVNDDGGDGLNSRVIVVPAETGTYHICATCLLRVRRDPANFVLRVTPR